MNHISGGRGSSLKKKTYSNLLGAVLWHSVSKGLISFRPGLDSLSRTDLRSSSSHQAGSLENRLWINVGCNSFFCCVGTHLCRGSLKLHVILRPT